MKTTSQFDIDDAPILALVEQANSPPRLINALKRAAESGRLPFNTVREYLQAGSEASRQIGRCPGLGLKLARELETVLRRFVAANPALAAPISSAATEIVGHTSSAGDSKAECDAVVDIPSALKLLTDREQAVLRARYGIGTASETLQEIGSRLSLTRERIRQIEKRALRKLASGGLGKQLRDYLLNEQQHIHEQLAGRGIILKGTENDLEKRLSPEYRLALDATFGGLREWLTTNGILIDGRWCLDRSAHSDLEVARCALQQSPTKWPLPRPFGDLAIKLDINERILAAAADLTDNISSYLGYAVDGNLTKRQRRRVRLHQIFAGTRKFVPLKPSQLLATYHARYPDDHCSIRDIEIVMGDSPHLFLKMFDFGWTAIGLTDRCLPKLERTADEREYREADSEPESEEKAGTVAGILRQILVAEGPLEFVKLRKLFGQRSGGKHSIASVGPILLLRDEFVRLAPGMYGTQAQKTEVDAGHQRYSLLLGERHCRLYVKARWAGEPADSYPLWTPAMEHRWCLWAERNAAPDVFESLLYVIDVNKWPVDEEHEKRHWDHIRRTRAKYSLLDREPSLTETLPRLEDILAVATYASWRGSVSWFSANRVTGHRVDDAHIASVLALLVWCGGLKAAKHWQGRHDAVPDRIRELATQLSLNAFDNGLLHPLPTTVDVLLSRGVETLGWVDAPKLEELRSEVRSEWETDRKTSGLSLTDEKGAKEGETLGNSLDDLLRETKRKRLIERLSLDDFV